MRVRILNRNFQFQNDTLWSYSLAGSGKQIAVFIVTFSLANASRSDLSPPRAAGGRRSGCEPPSGVATAGKRPRLMSPAQLGIYKKNTVETINELQSGAHVRSDSSVLFHLYRRSAGWGSVIERTRSDRDAPGRPPRAGSRAEAGQKPGCLARPARSKRATKGSSKRHRKTAISPHPES